MTSSRDDSQNEAGQLLRIAREAEGLALAVTRLQARRYADGVAEMIRCALLGVEPEEGAGLPSDCNALTVARDACRVIKQVHELVQTAGDVRPTTVQPGAAAHAEGRLNDTPDV